MKTSKVIKKLQELVDKEGDKEFHIYNYITKALPLGYNIDYDDAKDDIFICVRC